VWIVRLDDDEIGTYQKCNRQLIEIDHYGERLIGCIDCNRWSWEGSKRLFMELPVGGSSGSERQNNSDISGPMSVFESVPDVTRPIEFFQEVAA
jgi:hypothetical protein